MSAHAVPRGRTVRSRRILWIGLLFSALLLCACTARDAAPDREPEEGTSAAETEEMTEMTTELTINQTMRLICIGDSNTYGMDPRGYSGGRYEEQIRWTGQLVREDREVVNCGVNGATIPREEQVTYLLDDVGQFFPADAVTVMLGTNDLLIGYPAELCAQRMEQLILGLQQRLPEARIFLICPPATPVGSEEERQELIAETAELSRAYRELADRCGITFADAGSWGIELEYDGVHFSQEGHAAFAAALDALLDDAPEA